MVEVVRAWFLIPLPDDGDDGRRDVVLVIVAQREQEVGIAQHGLRGSPERKLRLRVPRVQGGSPERKLKSSH